MTNEIISYLEMCQREGVSLQRGMNYRIGGEYSVILMSVRQNAPYRDKIIDEGSTLIYEGHDLPRNKKYFDPKQFDQPEFISPQSDKYTENGKFHKAAQDYKKGLRDSEKVFVYEKIHPGIWSFNGVFNLVDSWKEQDGQRYVFKFKLVTTDDSLHSPSLLSETLSTSQRLIPSAVKLAVWKRDAGKCVICGAKDELHFDHIIPYSKGGSSSTSNNIQLLCARHNLMKRDKIE